MHIEADRATLVDLLSRVVAVSGLEPMRLEAGGRQLRVFGSNMSRNASVAISKTVHVETPGNAMVPAQLTAAAASRMPDGNMVVAVEDGSLILAEEATHNPRFNIRLLRNLQEPDIANDVDGIEFTVDGPEFMAAIRQVTPYASGNSARTTLQAVGVAGNPNSLQMMATDSYRVAIRTLPYESVPMAAILPLTAGLAEKTVIADQMRVTFGKQTAKLDGDGQLTLRLVKGKFPNVGKVVGSVTPVATVDVDRDAFREVLDRANIIAAHTLATARLTARKGTLRVEIASKEVGDFDDETAADFREHDGWDGTPRAFNTGYLLDALNTINGDTIRIEFADHRRPSKFSCPDVENFEAWIMPVVV